MVLQEMGNLEFVLANEMAGIPVKFKNVGFTAVMVVLALGKALWSPATLFFMISGNDFSTIKIPWATLLCKMLSKNIILAEPVVLILKAKNRAVFQLHPENKNILRIFLWRQNESEATMQIWLLDRVMC